jgi:DNA-directed RNA polymerase subunit RPC12/RpoP
LSLPAHCGIVAPEAMSEFKFACPVCGQHITADSSTSGGQIECPTCFQKIVVPQAPASSETKFILSASQVSKPRPTSTDTASSLGARGPSSNRSSIAATIALLVLLAAGGAALYLYRDRIFKPAHGPARTNSFASKPVAPVVLNATYPVPTNTSWTLDLTNIVIPDTAVAGRIHGSGFLSEKAVLRGGVLSFSQGEKWPWDLGVALYLFARRGEELSGKTVEIAPDRPRAPRVVLRWKNEAREPATETLHTGYALKLAFGQATNRHMPGQIYICLPDAARSFIAGTFDAEIRKPPPPRSRSPRPPPRRPPPTP